MIFNSTTDKFYSSYENKVTKACWNTIVIYMYIYYFGYLLSYQRINKRLLLKFFILYNIFYNNTSTQPLYDAETHLDA